MLGKVTSFNLLFNAREPIFSFSNRKTDNLVSAMYYQNQKL